MRQPDADRDRVGRGQLVRSPAAKRDPAKTELDFLLEELEDDQRQLSERVRIIVDRHDSSKANSLTTEQSQWTKIACAIALLWLALSAISVRYIWQPQATESSPPAVPPPPPTQHQHSPHGSAGATRRELQGASPRGECGAVRGVQQQQRRWVLARTRLLWPWLLRSAHLPPTHAHRDGESVLLKGVEGTSQNQSRGATRRCCPATCTYRQTQTES